MELHHHTISKVRETQVRHDLHIAQLLANQRTMISLLQDVINQQNGLKTLLLSGQKKASPLKSLSSLLDPGSMPWTKLMAGGLILQYLARGGDLETAMSTALKIFGGG
jgi:hypothetical protein